MKSRDQARRERHWALTERPRLLLDLADEIAKELEAMRDEAENPAQRRQRLRAVKQAHGPRRPRTCEWVPARQRWQLNRI